METLKNSGAENFLYPASIMTHSSISSKIDEKAEATTSTQMAVPESSPLDDKVLQKALRKV